MCIRKILSKMFRQRDLDQAFTPPQLGVSMFDPESLGDYGFLGLKTISELNDSLAEIPDVEGIYIVYRDILAEPEFLPTSTGGWFKGQDPTVHASVLNEKWIPNAYVLYIGKAGGPNLKSNLRTRLQQFISFGQGKKTAHWGGRYIWQLKNSGNLRLAYKPIPGGNPESEERSLITEFTSEYGNMPFANLR